MTYKILSNEQMAAADRATIESGVPSFTLMRNAARVVFEEIAQLFPQGSVLVLCGPGNNGGDGFLLAQILDEAGWSVDLACFTKISALSGDVAHAAREWGRDVMLFADINFEALEPETLVVDAIFGTGFSRELTSDVVKVFTAIAEKKCPVLAVDIPSGVNGTSGAVDPQTLRADVTVTFHRKKLGHALHPGASYCGAVIVRDIGITAPFEHEALENNPELWLSHLPAKEEGAHKYAHGHGVIYGAPKLTGATRLAASACARIGAGLTSVIAPQDTGAIYRTSLPAHIMVRDDEDWIDRRVTAILYGPGGLAGKIRFRKGCVTILDAEALKILPEDLLEYLADNVILTPHEGEFVKAFPEITQGSKLERACSAAKESDALIVLKGADTIIAHPDGRAVINTHASPDLASAGTGDVLAGLIIGLAAQGMEPFYAACAAVWMHGEAAISFGPGLVASDIPKIIPQVLQDFA